MFKPGQKVQICAPNRSFLVVSTISKDMDDLRCIGNPRFHRRGELQVLDGGIATIVKCRKPLYFEHNFVCEVEFMHQPGVIAEVYASELKAI